MTKIKPYSKRLNISLINYTTVKLRSTIDYDRERFEMYNQELVIAPYFEKGKATKEEIEKVLDYVSEKYQLSKKDNVKKK